MLKVQSLLRQSFLTRPTRLKIAEIAKPRILNMNKIQIPRVGITRKLKTTWSSNLIRFSVPHPRAKTSLKPIGLINNDLRYGFFFLMFVIYMDIYVKDPEKNRDHGLCAIFWLFCLVVC